MGNQSNVTAAAPAGIPIFGAGRHTSVDGRTIDFSDADLAEIAASYNTGVFESPLVVGHPKLDDPAYGWAKSLRVEGGQLFAVPHQVEPQFAEMVNSGRFKKISPSFYLRDTPGNPVPGKLYLRHVGFLGAAAPSVKGLPAVVNLAENDGAVEFAAPLANIGNPLADVLQRLRDLFTAQDAGADSIIASSQIGSIDQIASHADATLSPSYAEHHGGNTTQESDMPNEQQAADFAERQKTLDTRQTDIDTREKTLQSREDKAQRSDAAEFAEGLVKAGQLLPREKAAMVEVLLALPAGASVSFAEGDLTVSQPAPETLRTFLSGLPPRVDYAEKSHADNATNAVSFAAPAGTVIDGQRNELYTRAKQYQAANPNVDWLAAVRAVGG